MGVTSREALCIVEIIYYVPALLPAVYVIKKHGFGRQLGWIYLVILGILRLIGAATGIAAIHSPSLGLIECSTITFSVGLSPLLLALLGILQRLSEGMKGQGISPQIFRVCHIPIIVGLILAIIAGTKEYDTNTSTRNDGYTYAKTGIILLVVGFMILVAMTLAIFGKKRHILEGEHRLAVA